MTSGGQTLKDAVNERFATGPELPDTHYSSAPPPAQSLPTMVRDFQRVTTRRASRSSPRPERFRRGDRLRRRWLERDRCFADFVDDKTCS